MIWLVIQGQTFESVELRQIFQILDRNKNKTNVRRSVTDEIITSNSKNIGYNVKKGAVLAVKRKSKVVYVLIKKNYMDRFLKNNENCPEFKNTKVSAQVCVNKHFSTFFKLNVNYSTLSCNSVASRAFGRIWLIWAEIYLPKFLIIYN